MRETGALLKRTRRGEGTAWAYQTVPAEQCAVVEGHVAIRRRVADDARAAGKGQIRKARHRVVGEDRDPPQRMDIRHRPPLDAVGRSRDDHLPLEKRLSA
jgi:hypothetical protein